MRPGSKQAARAAATAAAAGIFLLFAAPSPAAAADPAQIECPVEMLDAAGRERLADLVARQAEDDAAFAPFYGSIARCMIRHNWSEGEAEQSLRYNLALFGQRAARRNLEGMGVDVAAIERLLLADPRTIEAARSEDPGDGMAAFVERLEPALLQRLEAMGGDGAEQLGAFLLFRAAMETSRADFAGKR
jgi:hypothetical protein